MTTVIDNFLSVRKNRGDILSPTQYRTIVEMIRGILSQYDYATFSEIYQGFLAHLVNYSDPHKVTSSGFSDEIIATAYSVYTNMTPTPLSQTDFTTNLVPTWGFIELLRRIVLNRIAYNQIKNNDGTVPATVSLYLTKEWGHSRVADVPVTVTFPSSLANEAAFIRSGWGTNSAPIPIVFNAVDLDVTPHERACIFHTSVASPHYAYNDAPSGYSFDMFGSSNDLVVDIETMYAPTTQIPLITLLNGSKTLVLYKNASGTVNLTFGSSTILQNIPCGDGRLSLTVSKSGDLTLTTLHNGSILTSTSYIDLTDTPTFITGIVGSPLVNIFSTNFGLVSLTVSKPVIIGTPTPAITPMIFNMAPASVVPIVGTVSGNGNSTTLIPELGYKLYLTLSGTWTGTVLVQSSYDNGLTWSTLTTRGVTVGSITRNCDEELLTVTNDRARYRLSYAIASGSLTYRLAQ